MAMSDDLRARILAAVLDVRLHLGPNALSLASRGEAVRLSGNEADSLTEVVMSVLDEAFAQPPLAVYCDPVPETPELAILRKQFQAAYVRDKGKPLKVLPPNAVMIRRRTPEQRRAYLVEHRDEAIANGIPEQLIDLFIQEAEDPDA
jgi:hypothetical protein